MFWYWLLLTKYLPAVFLLSFDIGCENTEKKKTNKSHKMYVPIIV